MTKSGSNNQGHTCLCTCFCYTICFKKGSAMLDDIDLDNIGTNCNLLKWPIIYLVSLTDYSPWMQLQAYRNIGEHSDIARNGSW